MTTNLKFANVEVGTKLPALSVPIQRLDLIRYAGASGDFNIIHWNERFATSVGLPNVIAHGMFTMASAIRVVTDWVGDPGAVVEYGVRFTRTVPVPDDGVGVLLEISGEVTELLEAGRVRVTLTASSAGQTVLGRAQAVVQLA
ncbi:MAG: dehydratase [Actinobacteria bacterium]|nr:MAG: dehydratase [Actinomycetota bacterium]